MVTLSPCFTANPRPLLERERGLICSNEVQPELLRRPVEPPRDVRELPLPALKLEGVLPSIGIFVHHLLQEAERDESTERAGLHATDERLLVAEAQHGPVAIALQCGIEEEQIPVAILAERHEVGVRRQRQQMDAAALDGPKILLETVVEAARNPPVEGLPQFGQRGHRRDGSVRETLVETVELPQLRGEPLRYLGENRGDVRRRPPQGHFRTSVPKVR